MNVFQYLHLKNTRAESLQYNVFTFNRSIAAFIIHNDVNPLFFQTKADPRYFYNTYIYAVAARAINQLSRLSQLPRSA